MTSRRPTALRMPPPTHAFAGSCSQRQSVGDPGHCEDCATRGHVAAHPGLGCGDVGCTSAHGPDDGAERDQLLPPGTAVRRTAGTGAPSDYGTVHAAVRGGYDVAWVGQLTPQFVGAAEVEPVPAPRRART